jgi:hypothetical protein
MFHIIAVMSHFCITVGSTMAGRYSDWLVVSLRKSRGGVWVPEDRLRATPIGGLILTPCSILFSGLATQYLEGRPSIIINFICFVLNGIGVRISTHLLLIFLHPSFTLK